MQPEILCRTLFVSDVHLGCENSRAEELCGLLDRVKTQKLAILGDLWDFWSTGKEIPADSEKQDPWQTKLLQKITDMQRKGVEVFLTPGNHDAFEDKNVNESSIEGLKVAQEMAYTTADGRRLLVLHGDDLDGKVLGNRKLGVLCTRTYDAMENLSDWLDIKRSINTVDLAFRLVGLPEEWSMGQALQRRYHETIYQKRMEDAAIAYLFAKNIAIWKQNKDNPSGPQEKYFDAIMCGHSHVMRSIECLSPRDENGNPIGPATVAFFNTGCWIGDPQDKKDIQLYGRAPATWEKLRNTAIIERLDGTLEHLWCVSGEIIQLPSHVDWIPDSSSRISPKQRLIYKMFDKVQNGCKGLNR